MSKLSLGSIEFINSLPVDLGMTSGAVPVNARIVHGAPAVLNEKILEGELDVSPVSAFWYAQHQKELLILPDLSISSESGVQSVLLFSRYPFARLENKRIAVTNKGRTTPALLEILCRLRYGFKPQLEIMPAQINKIPDGCDAILLIGDDALEARELLRAEKFDHAPLQVMDLAQEWRTWTKTPFVFALWAVRRNSFTAFPEKVMELHESILQSKKWGLGHLEDVIKEAGKRTALPEDILRSYFSRLSYDLNDDLKKGIRLYYDAAVQCGLLKRGAPLEEIEIRPVTKYKNIVGEFDDLARNIK